MPDASDHGQVILAAVLGAGGVRALDAASRHITAEHFEDRVQKALFMLAQRYADQTRGTLPRHALEDLLRNKPAGTALLYLEYYDLLASLKPSPSDFRHSVGMLRELDAERKTGEALAQGREILLNGAKDERGDELRGHGDARAHVVSRFAAIERETAAGSNPEGDMREDTGRMLERYAAAQAAYASGHAAGISTGIARLDGALSGGLNPGELALVIGFTSSGKSQWMAHWAWHAAVELKKNVVLFSSETVRDNMEIRIAGRHSRLPQFGLRKGLNTRDIRGGYLTGAEYAAYRDVLNDVRTGDYGKLYIVQVPRGVTVPWTDARLAAIARQFDPGLCIIDYLGLYRPAEKCKDKREALSLILQDAKQLAVTFGDGLGIPVVSPWQINREGRKAVRERGYYSLSDLAETAEAANTPDVILSLLEPETDESRGRQVPLRLDVLKNRENERYVRLDLMADFANSYFALREESGPELPDDLMAEEE